MNLYLARGCNERCSFCYAEDWFDGPPARAGVGLDDLLTAIRAYARLVADAPPLPPWSADQDEFTRTLTSSRCINLLGGEPTLHPHFQRVVEEIHGLGLGVIVFTNASRPKRIQAVADKLWMVCINGHFADRAPALGMPLSRMMVNLPISPGDDVTALLERVHQSGIKAAVLAFVAPAGGTPGRYFTPLDLEEMQRLHAQALAFCDGHGMHLGYDCSFPLCVDARVEQTKCSSVPVMDTGGDVTICGGAYFYEGGRRNVATFDTLDALHRHTWDLQQGLRALPSKFDHCNTCAHFNKGCHGMCLAFRVGPGAAPLPEDLQSPKPPGA